MEYLEDMEPPNDTEEGAPSSDPLTSFGEPSPMPFGTILQTPGSYLLNSQPQNALSAAGMPMNLGDNGMVINIQNGHNYHVDTGTAAATGFVSHGVGMGMGMGMGMGLNIVGRGGVAGAFPLNTDPVAGMEMGMGMGMGPSTSGQGINTPANGYNVGAVNRFTSGGGSTNSNLLGSGIPSGSGDSTHHGNSNNSGSSTVAGTAAMSPLEIRHLAAVLAFRRVNSRDVPSGPVQLSNRNSGGSYVGRNTSGPFNQEYWRFKHSLTIQATAADARLPNGNTPDWHCLGPGYTPKSSRNGASGPPQAGTQASSTAAAVSLAGNVQATATGTRVQISGTGPLPNGAGVLSNGTSVLPSNTGGQGHSATPPTPSGSVLPMDMNGFPAMGMGPQVDLMGVNIGNGMPTAQLTHPLMPTGIPVSNTGTMPRGTDQSQSNGPQFSPWGPQRAEQNALDDEDNGQGDGDEAEADRYIEEFGPQEEGSL